MSVYDMMVERGQKKELEAPVYPTLEQNNIVEQTEARIAESEKRAAEMERQAKRDRDMAIWGDLANLVVKGAAMHGGARKFNKDESATAKANERLRAVQKENIAQMATFAKERMAAADAARKERNAAKVAQFNAEMDAYKRAQAQANADRTHEETVRYHDEGLKIQQEREKRLGKQGDDNSDVFHVTMPNGEVKTFSKKEHGNNFFETAWQAALKAGMKPLMKQELVRGSYGEVAGVNEVAESNLAKRKAWLEEWSYENGLRGDTIVWDDDSQTDNVDKDFE